MADNTREREEIEKIRREQDRQREQLDKIYQEQERIRREIEKKVNITGRDDDDGDIPPPRKP